MLIKIETFTLSVTLENAQKLKNLLDSNYIGILDMDGRYDKWNRGIRQIVKFLCETSSDRHEALLEILDETDYDIYYNRP